MGERKSKPPVKTRPSQKVPLFKRVSARELTESVLRIYSLQEEKRERNSAHNSGHMLRTGIAAARYSRKKNGETAKLAAITGLLHDFVRAPREVEGRSDGIITADLLKYMVFGRHKIHRDYIDEYSRLESLYPEEMKVMRTFFQPMERETIDIAEAIEFNERKISEIIRIIIAFRNQGIADRALIQEALLYGDQGIEGIGPSVVVRRAQFVSGERAENPEDVGAMRDRILSSDFSENEFRLLAFLGESMIRMYAKKAIDDFPKGGMWDELRNLRKVEASVCHSLVMYFLKRGPFRNEKEILEFLHKNDFPRMDSFAVKILDNLGNSEFTLPLLASSKMAKFVRSSINLVLGLAYSQSKEEILRKNSENYMRQVEDPDIRKIVEEVGVEVLKEEFIWLLEQ